MFSGSKVEDWPLAHGTYECMITQHHRAGTGRPCPGHRKTTGTGRPRQDMCVRCIVVRLYSGGEAGTRFANSPQAFASIQASFRGSLQSKSSSAGSPLPAKTRALRRSMHIISGGGGLPCSRLACRPTAGCDVAVLGLLAKRPSSRLLSRGV